MEDGVGDSLLDQGSKARTLSVREQSEEKATHLNAKEQ
jgi:hypothetical protein